MTTFRLESYFGVESVVFDNGTGDADADGSRWFLTNEQGWYNVPSPQGGGASEPISNMHGGVRSPTTYNPRQIILSGACIATSGTQALTSRRRLARLHVSLMQVRGRLIVLDDGDDWPLASEVYVASDLRMDPPNGSKSFGFEIGLTAPDPRKYSWGDEASGALVVIDGSSPGGGEHVYPENLGNFDTFPTFETLDPGTVSVTNMTDPYYQPRVFVKNSVPVNTIVDNQKRTIMKGFVNYFDKIDLNVTDWWSLNPGESDVRLAGTTLRMSFRHAFI